MTDNNYAISEYPNTDEIYGAAEDTRSSQPHAPHQAREDAGVPELLRQKCASSKALTDEAKTVSFPAGCSTTWPSTIPSRSPSRKREGAYLWDVDGNRYIDFLQAGGPTVLGSNYAPVREKVFELLQDLRPGHGPVPRIRTEAGAS